MAKVNYGQMSAGVIDESLKELGIASDKVKTIPAKAQLLIKHFKSAGATLADCTVCGGASDENYPRCPFCGDTELIDASEAQPAALATAATTIIEQAAPAATGSKRVKKPKAGEQPPATALAVVPEAAASTVVQPDPKFTQKDLDKAVGRAVRHSADLAKNVWAYGNEILGIHEKSLWMLRKDEAGKAKYHTFNQFCKEELGMSHTQAYRYMGVTKTFDEQTVAELGPKKLSLVMHQPEEERQRLLQEIKGGATQGEITEQVRRTNRANNAGTRTPAVQTEEQISRAKDIAVMVRAPKAIEIAMLGVGTKGKPAKTLADDPWAEEEHENGVISRYVVKVDPETGIISLIITRRRVGS